MAILVPEAVLDGLERVRQEGKTNMLDRLAVQYYANENDDYEMVLWLEDNPRLYAHGVFEGFEVEGT